MGFGMQRWPRRAVGIRDTKLKAGTKAGKQLLATARSDFLWVRSWTQREAQRWGGEQGKEPFPAASACTLGAAFPKCLFPSPAVAAAVHSEYSSPLSAPNIGPRASAPTPGLLRAMGLKEAAHQAGNQSGSWGHLLLGVGQSHVPMRRAEWVHQTPP